MEIKILDSILHGALKPWLADFSDTASLKEIIRAASKIDLANSENIHHRLKLLLKPYPSLLANNNQPISTLKQLSATTPMPAAYDLITNYYHLLISSEVQRYFNAVLVNPYILDDALDVPYQIGHKVLIPLASLANKVQNTLVEDGLSDETSTQNNHVQYCLVYLRNSLIALYFSIQAEYKDHLTDVYNTVDDFYLYIMDDDTNKVSLTFKESEKEVISIAQSNNEAFSFGFKGDSDKLKQLIQLLCTHHNLLEETVTTQDDFLQLLSTKNIYDKKYKIQFGCNTNLATYILESLKRSIPKLKFSNIENCGYFFTDNGNFLKQSNLSNSKSKNELLSEPKAKIDKIFKDCSI